MYSINLGSLYGLIVCFCTGVLALLAAYFAWSSGSSRGGQWGAWVYRAFVVIPVILFVVAIGQFALNLPFYDDYDAFLRYFLIPLPKRLLSLASFHNEHRIAFVRAVAECVYAVKGTLDFRWMIFAGNALFLALFGLLLREMWKSQVAPVYVIPVFWAFLSILLFQNMLWALTAIHSNSVILFAYLSFALFAQRTRACFLGALLCAIVATYTSGAGMCVWPCLILFLAKAWLIDRQAFPWRAGLSVMILGAISIGLYFVGFGAHGKPQEIAILSVHHLINVVGFLLTFCGAACHFVLPSALVGAGVLLVAVLLVVHVKRITNMPVFLLFVYLLGTALIAALFRAGDDGLAAGLGFRYRINSLCMMVCCLVLLKDILPEGFSVLRKGVRTAITGYCVALNLMAFLLAYPQLELRKQKQIEGLRQWKIDVSGLVYPEEKRVVAQQLLEACQRKGIYDPDHAYPAAASK